MKKPNAYRGAKVISKSDNIEAYPLLTTLHQVRQHFNIRPPGWALRWRIFDPSDPLQYTRHRQMLRMYLGGLPRQEIK